MLVLTPAAVTVVNALTTGNGMSGDAGLRIALPDEGPPEGLTVQVVPGPAAEEQVLGANGVNVFLDQHAAAFLDDKILDAEVDEEGAAQLTIGPQTPENGLRVPPQ
ncbi:iron-sulfur cluster biosynthesis protein [Amycolatopsis sp. OK19-0408]|uniref:Iron-sulfur cluster biosynthesis protein n=1 Tax=Amycolatopsis iheyensis TaxID=2945988 RepID=A0A9X2SQ68_9PSEU|nr:iron-sulfur cluster biosynthesis protein [Amycolatopsis iheyensis]MCR6490779.1 iron-sulfur cluster biosynthesis protein [Amycolatopsis iheyensis]